jgi:tetratricopeptide (TPR) repeat protein
MEFKSGLLKESRESLQKSLALGPTAVASASLAQELRAEGRYKEALSYAQKAASLDSDDDEIWRELGDCYSALPGYREKARAAYTKAAEKAESHLQTNNSEGPRWMLLALYQAKLNQAAAALSSLGKAEAGRAFDLDSQLTKIRILEVLGKRRDALDTVAACLRRGASKFEMDAMPDLQSLRADHRYLTLFHSI